MAASRDVCLFRPKALGALLVCLGAIMAAGSPGRAQETPLAGDWSGTYNCAAIRNNPFTLQITSATDDRIAGVFRFDVPAAPGREGAYEVIGRVTADGHLTLVPQRWITRPDGFRPLGLIGMLHPNGRMIEGNIPDCGIGSSFTAALQGESEGAQAGESDLASANPVSDRPVSGGPIQGLWHGTVTCGMNRRTPQRHAVQAQVFQDGAGIAALFRIAIHRARGGTLDHAVLVTGRTEGHTLSLGHPIVLAGRIQPRFRGMEATLDAAAATLTGRPTMSGCQEVALERAGPVPATALSADLEGLWHGVIGRTDVTAAVSVGTDIAFVELRATYPNDRPSAARDRLVLSLVPLHTGQGRTLLAPVGIRDATGVFDRNRRQHTYHSLTASRAFVIPDEAADVLEIWEVSQDQDIARTMGQESVRAARRDMVLKRADQRLADALEGGATPPAELAGSLGGTLAAAESREAQCAVLEAWLEPHRGDTDLQRLSIDAGNRVILDAFADQSFIPVFGMPFVLLSPEERRSVRQLLETHCGRAMAMRNLTAQAVVQPFGSDQNFLRRTILLANRIVSHGVV